MKHLNKVIKQGYVIAFLLFIFSSASNGSTLILADIEQLSLNKKSFNDVKQQSVEWRALSEKVKQDLAMKPLSVTLSAPLLPEGNPHDYYSVGPYWWPNPDTKDGLPWLKRDGERNYQFRGEYSDNRMFFRLASAISRLGLIHYYTNDAQYAEKLQALVEHWFLNPKTAMTPHLDFGQGVPGVANGRPYGIIEFRHLLLILDAVTLAEHATDKQFNQRFNIWTAQFLDWLINSEIGAKQATKHNNHGTYYDAIVAGLHLFLGDNQQAIDVFNTTKKRIVGQITPSGLQPHELERTRPYHYSAFNLLAFTQLAQMAEQVDVDLWHYPNKSDPRILTAFNYLLDNAKDRKLWQGKSEAKVNLRHMVVPALRINRFQPVDFKLILEHPSSHPEFTMCKLLFVEDQYKAASKLMSKSLACTL